MVGHNDDRNLDSRKRLTEALIEGSSSALRKKHQPSIELSDEFISESYT